MIPSKASAKQRQRWQAPLFSNALYNCTDLLCNCKFCQNIASVVEPAFEYVRVCVFAEPQKGKLLSGAEGVVD
jgi:hypothetical protein